MVYDLLEFYNPKKQYDLDSTKTQNSSMVVLKPSMSQVFIAQPKKRAKYTKYYTNKPRVTDHRYCTKP